MIVLDTSALMALLLDEPDRGAIVDALEEADALAISAGTLVACAVVARRWGVAEAMARMLARLSPRLLPVGAEGVARIAAADARWGRGAHPAGLNFGDLFAYDAAKRFDAALLFIGDDFTKTDLRAALA